MFKELKGLGVVVKQLSNELRKVVSIGSQLGLLSVILLPLSLPLSPSLSLSFPLLPVNAFPSA